MKKTDIAMIILVASLSIVVAYFVASAIPALNVSDLKENVQKTDAISPDLAPVDARLFSKDAINPTQQTVIGPQQ